MTDVRENLLRNKLLSIAEEKGYGNPEFKISAVPVTGSNFTSELFHATISSPGKEDLNVFAKVAVIGEAMREVMPFKMFDIERYVYTKLLAAFKELEDKYEVPAEHRLIVPKFYGYSETHLEEIIVLEDLSLNGFTMYDRFTSIDWDYASTAIEQLATLHGLSIAFQKEYPEEYEEAKKLLKTENIVHSENANERLMWDMVDNSIQMVREENRPLVQQLFNQKFDPTTFMNYQVGENKVIIHGDFKQTNLMHKFDENGKLQVIILDYQTLRPSCAAFDLLYFVLNCADGQFRKQHYQQLIDHYYQHMTDELRRLHLDPVEVYSRADFDKELKEMLPYALINSVITLPIFFIQHSDVQQVGPDSTIESMTRIMMNKNDICAQKINEVVDDCKRWGVI